jgi:signal transduction histidine kinase
MTLYRRLLLWFVLAAVVSIAATITVGTWVWRGLYSEREAQRDGQEAASVYEAKGEEGLMEWLRRKREDSRVVGMLLDDAGRPLMRPRMFTRRLDGPVPPPGEAGEPPESGVIFNFEDSPGGPSLTVGGGEPAREGEDRPPPDSRFERRVMALQPPESGGPVLSVSGVAMGPQGALNFSSRGDVLFFGLAGGPRSVKVVSQSGKNYQWIASLRPMRGGRDAQILDFSLRIGVALLVIAAVALLAARRITRPVARLQAATERLAQGDLEARVPVSVSGRGDELDRLASSFNDMADRLARSVQTQRQLLRDISHELRTPLARLRIASELAREQHRGEHFDRIEVEAEKLDELIGQALLLARLEAGHPGGVNGEHEDLVLDELLADLCADAAMEAAPRGVRIESSLAPGITLNARPMWLRSAFENVLRNALRYTARDSTVEVRLAREEQQIVATIADRGPGVPEEMLGPIFEPFVRTSDARERDSGGYGLGLAIAAGAVKAHGGSIRAMNREGGGLAVEIRLPA